jgi:hypothetical protein
MSTGYYSIEIQVNNYTYSTFAIQAAYVDGPTNSWITNEQPTVGGNLPQQQSLSMGVSTNDQDGIAGGYLAMTAIDGSQIPITVTFQIPPGRDGVAVTTPSTYAHSVIQQSTGENNHVRYQVTITQAPPTRFTRHAAAKK